MNGGLLKRSLDHPTINKAFIMISIVITVSLGLMNLILAVIVERAQDAAMSLIVIIMFISITMIISISHIIVIIIIITIIIIISSRSSSRSSRPTEGVLKKGFQEKVTLK